MIIKGLQKLTLLDYPDRIACTVFTGGCNFRCPFCHNASLVLPERWADDISETEFFDYLESRCGKLCGVCVSGGEPTLHSDLVDFIAKIKAMGYAVKLDTNGSRPGVLSSLIDGGFVDYVAMDIKNSPNRYGETVGVCGFDIEPVLQSAEILMSGRVDFEFRTTVVRELHTENDIRAIGEWLRGGEKFFLQSFVNSGDLIGGGFSSYSDAEMRELCSVICEYIPNAKLRG